MSATAQSLRLRSPDTRSTDAPPGTRARALRERPAVRIVAFAALGLYGVLRWGTLLANPPTGRLLGLLVIAVGLGAVGPFLHSRSRALALMAAVAGVLAAFPLSGVPLAWVLHLRIAVSADAIGQGLQGLPEALVPYAGGVQWVSLVIMLGAAVLLLDAALLLAFSPSSLGDARRAGVALPLIALAVVPSTLLRPHLPYLQGLMLFILLAVFMWGELVRRTELSWALTIGALAALGALLLAPALDRHRPWIDPQSIAGSFAPADVETFDWSQQYGPLIWPQAGREVLDVQATHGDYWKAEDLDSFDGRGWVTGGAAYVDPLADVSASSLARFTQTIRVTLRAMSTSTVIASGTAALPTNISASVVQGASPGTWIAGGPLGPGDSYLVSTYAPHPTVSQLARAGHQYPNRALVSYRTLELPAAGAAGAAIPVVFPPFHSGWGIEVGPVVGGSGGAAVVAASPYARAFALARRLAAQAATPYSFVAGVEAYLGHGFTYSENPPDRRYPLESFLFQARLGYCQQFAGAMALLLRMGGIPARVAAGFTSGTYDAGRHEFVVSDLDAHAWVEAWFPHYGWVRFDPTPAVAPARGGGPISAAPPVGAVAKSAPAALARHAGQLPAATSPASRHSSGSAGAFLIVGCVLAGLVAGGAVALGSRRRRRPPSEDELIAELERALARTGRPVAASVTLAALEHRLHPSPQAEAYVRALRLARFRGGGEPPNAQQRRALRSQLAAGLGFAGALRALWALPPGWPVRKRASGRRFRGINS